ncbi:hypothetical protein CRG98_005398 [Punica granatum]|uniref:Uncharacterized protein n=1 Tax=Punica granatum TaxID=22663 RepID=A0A2I0L0R3_PUNGR|nr:hypothetical protein CRG98_005398 [Punica granatum]
MEMEEGRWGPTSATTTSTRPSATSEVVRDLDCGSDMGGVKPSITQISGDINLADLVWGLLGSAALGDFKRSRGSTLLGARGESLCNGDGDGGGGTGGERWLRRSGIVVSLLSPYSSVSEWHNL